MGAISAPASTTRRGCSRSTGVLIALSTAVLTAWIPSLAQDSIELPEPSGKYVIGTAYLGFTDASRADPFSADTTMHRELTARAWYPAENTSRPRRAPYLRDPEAVVPVFGLPAALRTAGTHAFIDAPVSAAEDSWPVLVYNHGWGEHFAQSTALMEELASHGYIVFSLAHHGEVKFSFRPDGEAVLLDVSNPRFRAIAAEQRNPEALAVFRRMFGADGRDEQESIFSTSNELMPTFLVESPRIWAEDISRFIDELERLNRSEGLFEGKLRLERVGVLGMSMGGIAAGQACLADDRCAAGINMDGGLYGDPLGFTIGRPFMFMNSERYSGYDEFFLEHVSGPGYDITIADSDHQNFSDLSVLAPSSQMMGTINGHRMLAVINAYTLAFFDKHLRGIDSRLLDGASERFPEVNVTVKGSPR